VVLQWPIIAGTRRLGSFSSGFRPPFSDELGNQVAIFRDVARDDPLRLLKPFLSRFAVHRHSQMMWWVGLAGAAPSESQPNSPFFAGTGAI